MLDFQPLSIGMKKMIDSYTFNYGEGSCQHSFVSSFCLNEKYGDIFFEHDNFLYTLRSKKCTENERIYLFPHGDVSDSQALKNAVENILTDSHEHNSLVKFETITENAKNLLSSLFPEKFNYESRRDLSEYIYKVEKLASYSGAELAYKRRDFQRFGRDYKDRVEVEKINSGNIESVKEFQILWLERKLSEVKNSEQYKSIKDEDNGIKIAFDNFFELGLTGIIVKIDGEIKGYAYGVRLSKDYIDEINENCLHEIPNIYPFAKHEFARLCCEDCKYINFEEDVGSLNLRAAKNHYKPEFLINKFTAREAV